MRELFPQKIRNERSSNHNERINELEEIIQNRVKADIDKANISEVYQAVGQVRNNKVNIDSSNVADLLWSDTVFKSFENTGKIYTEYEQQLFDEAKNKGIDDNKLKKTLETAKTLKGDKALMYPVIIDTAKHNDKDCFIFVFTWELKDMAMEKKNVSPLGHIFVVAIENDTQDVIFEKSCM